MNTKIRKSTIALVAVALLGTLALPAEAKNDNISFHVQNNVQKSTFRVFGTIAGEIIGKAESGDHMPSISSSLFSNDSSLKSARTAYNQAVKNANETFNTAKKAAKAKFVSAINASNDHASRMAALKTYLSELLTAIKQRSDAKESALQTFINALGNAQANQAPTANSQSVTTNEETPKAITLAGTDPQGTSLTYTVLTSPAHGTLSGTAPNLTYTPAANYAGSDSFTFKVNDGSLDSPAATVSITVTNVNDAPVANAQSVTTTKNTAKTITLTGSDTEGSTLSFFVVANPSHGTLSGTVPNLTYLPATDYTGSDSFTFKVNDGSLDSSTVTVTITVNP